MLVALASDDVSEFGSEEIAFLNTIVVYRGIRGRPTLEEFKKGLPIMSVPYVNELMKPATKAEWGHFGNAMATLAVCACGQTVCRTHNPPAIPIMHMAINRLITCGFVVN
jgi:hypothetical protein